MNDEKIKYLLMVQLNHIKQLDLLLKDEKKSLINRDYKTIALLAEQKQKLMHELKNIDNEISLIKKDIPLTDEQIVITDNIKTLLFQCHQDNLSNGKAIELSMNSISRLQRSLIQKRTGNSMTYNAKGYARGSGSSSGYTSA